MSPDQERRLEEIFSAARDLPALEQAAFLERACGGDAEMRQQADSLLVAHGQAGQFLQPTIAPPKLSAPVERPGDRIDRYKLLEQIGEGGFGVVWMAEQEEPLRRRVALKIIKLGMDTREVVARFDAERQALAMMDHPNIARVFDGGATDTGRPFFVMELVKGVPITAYCDANKLPTRERLALFLLVCQAVQHAHQKGVIHRDLKPSNVLVTVQDERLVPKVIDFGVAKATQARLTEKTVFTRFRQWIGTPAYMSPEQAGLGNLDVDTRSDVYSLGVLLYELLTGQTPFDAQKMLASGYAAVMQTIREEDPPKPSTRLSTLAREELSAVAAKRKAEPAKLGGLIRGDLDWIVMKALEKDRTRRYETANNLALDIGRHLQGEPVSAAAPTALYLAQKFVRRHRTGLATAAALALLLAAGTVVSTWQAVRATRAEQAQALLREQAQAGERKAHTEAAKSQQVAQFMKEMLNGVGPSVALGRDTAMLREILDHTADRVRVELKGEPEVEAELSYAMGEVYFELGEFDRAERMHRRALELRKHPSGRADEAVAMSTSHLGRVLLARRKLSEAEDLLRQGLAAQRSLPGPKPEELLFALNELSVVLNTQGGADQKKEAEALLREALALALKSSGEDSAEVAGTLEHLGEVLKQQGELTEAERLSRQALAIRRKSPNDEVALALSLMALTGVLERRQTKLDEAEALGREALTIQRRIYSKGHPALAGSLYTLARVLQTRGKDSEAEPLLREAAAIWKAAPGERDVSAATCLHYFGIALFTQHKLVEAESVLRDSAAAWRKLGARYEIQVAGSLYYLGRVLYERGNLSEAKITILEAIAIRKKLAVGEASAADSFCLLGQILQAQGRPQEAIGCYRKAAEQGGLAAIRSQRALALLYQRGQGVAKDPAEAAKWYRRLAEEFKKRGQGGDVQALNALAWLLTTCEIPEIRDGHSAVSYAATAVNATARKDPALLCTLAAAYAEARDFTNAVATQKEAMALVRDEAMQKDFSSRLKLYESKFPYREGAAKAGP
jgi:tetratricopeptide (TPR) repeat protein